MTVETKRAKGVRAGVGGATRAFGGGAGLALAGAAAVLGSGALGGCQSPAGGGPADDASAVAAAGEVAAAGVACEVAAAGAACEGGDCDAEGGGTAEAMPSCGPGSPKCDPEQNGLGVYVGRGGNFCLPTGTADLRFCAEAFINGSDGVKLRLYRNHGSFEPIDVPVTATFNPAGFGVMFGERLKSITTDKGRLVVTYTKATFAPAPAPGQIPSPAPAPLVVTDEQLGHLRLHFAIGVPSSAPPSYNLVFRLACEVPADGPEPRDVIKRYTARYQVELGTGTTAWAPLCTGGGRALKASFLGGVEVDDVSAMIKSNANAVTMSCETGGIDGCMTWGYAPWAGEADEKRAELFGACLQAKRAAYYVGRGDLGSYTKPGTLILLRDFFGVHRAPIGDASLEASWSSTGATCFNWEHRRRPEMLPDGHPEGITMPSCPPGTSTGLLLTGKTSLSSTAD